MASASTRLRMCWPPKINGLEPKRAESLPYATTEAVKVMAPMKAPMKSSMRWAPVCSSPVWKIAATAISTATRPTSECMAATSSGICVICTRRASVAPMAPPMMRPPAMNARLGRCSAIAAVVMMAMAMPIMP